MIGHFDIDAFYASVAQRDNPHLRGKPVAVSGRSRRSVVLTASYEARPYGVRSAMPLYRALELCPQLEVVHPDSAAYRAASAAVFSIFREVGREIEPLSLDEAYVDFSGFTAAACHRHLAQFRARANALTGLSVSAGAGVSKTVAKIACDLAKPDGLQIIEPGAEVEFLRPLPIGRLYGIGPKSEQRLIEAGITTIGDITACDHERLFAIFGVHGPAMQALALGIDHRVVSADRERKSFSTERTFERNVRGEKALLPTISEQAAELAETLERRGIRARNVAVKIKCADFRVRAKQTQLAEPSNNPQILFAAARHCLRSSGFDTELVRLVGVRVSDLTDDAIRQLPLWGNQL